MADGEERVYYESELATVTQSHIVIPPLTDRPAWADWLLGHPGEHTLALQSVTSITISEPSRKWPVLCIAIGLPLSLAGGLGIPIVIAGGLWLLSVNRFGRRVLILTGDDTGGGEVYGSPDEQDRIIKAVRNALADTAA